MKKENRPAWREVTSRKEEFQKIVGLLIEFDERTGRYQRYGDPESHYMRKAVARAQPDDLRIFVQNLGGFLYYVVVELASAGGRVSTGWLHEDGIKAERSTHPEDHPVQRIVCLSDLVDADSSSVSEETAFSCVDSATAELMAAVPRENGKPGGDDHTLK